MRTPLIAGNWKMFKTHLEALQLVQKLGYELAEHRFDRVEVALCPPFTALRTVQTLIDSDRLSFSLGAQNMYHEEEGAYTGEVSPPMLKALRVRYVILGHSERRQYFGESDDGVNKKVKSALAHQLTPIMCVGETESEREAGQTEATVETQVRGGLDGLTPEQTSKIVIAYEPVWAIGTGKTASPEDAQEVHAYIRALVSKEFSDEVGEGMRILYGGSVKAGNTAALMAQADLDGALVGGASIDAAEFAGIVKATG